MSLAGSVTHGGDSCQLSFSYDEGRTFKVIKSMIGGYLADVSYYFTIPTYALSGNAIFAWTWLNFIGNREFYMDCAAVGVNGGSSGSESAFNGLPNLTPGNCDGTPGSSSGYLPSGDRLIGLPNPIPGPEISAAISAAPDPATRYHVMGGTTMLGDMNTPTPAAFANRPYLSSPYTSMPAFGGGGGGCHHHYSSSSESSDYSTDELDVTMTMTITFGPSPTCVRIEDCDCPPAYW
ncbi:hypothetical protein P152DRAFT_477187 [Eremomyces bilateralis CBS 781.70]|uniref:Uncharacterized protein n=1 Tax=Eremomyces bilateralis CBS 781.70 TaxID=1392243 RepID=A0A6G1FS92_9PEZI|nr:uncharacterized protein P152DRAFT_477187 [Eremomyces bilateralis CBS 781.70]KAF1808654.1 hypothetical protein P152DRAFT_477187 [Eremomyces bilateralis CBS 781.70]